MTLVYPKNGKQDLSDFDDIHIIYKNDDVVLSQLEDTFVLTVIHEDGADKLGYDGECENGIHHISTKIDTNYHSKNLEFLINTFNDYEKIWQSK